MLNCWHSIQRYVCVKSVPKLIDIEIHTLIYRNSSFIYFRCDSFFSRSETVASENFGSISWHFQVTIVFSIFHGFFNDFYQWFYSSILIILQNALNFLQKHWWKIDSTSYSYGIQFGSNKRGWFKIFSAHSVILRCL